MGTTAALVVSIVSLVVSGAIALTGLAFGIWRYFRETADKAEQAEAERHARYADGPQQVLARIETWSDHRLQGSEAMSCRHYICHASHWRSLARPVWGRCASSFSQLLWLVSCWHAVAKMISAPRPPIPC